MKINFDYIIRYLRKYKFILLAVFVFIIILLNFKRVREGLTGSQIGEYQYLAPIPSGNKWTPTTIDQFVNKFNTVNSVTDGTRYLDFLNKWALEEEAQYYIQNGVWPYGSYISNYLSQNPGNIDGAMEYGKNLTASNIKQFYPSRFVFKLIQRYVANKNPLAYQIYMGTAQPPSSTSSSGLSSLSSSLSPSTTTTSSDPNYQSFISLCKKVIGTK
jgi:hypothetical protein